MIALRSGIVLKWNGTGAAEGWPCVYWEYLFENCRIALDHRAGDLGTRIGVLI